MFTTSQTQMTQEEELGVLMLALLHQTNKLSPHHQPIARARVVAQQVMYLMLMATSVLGNKKLNLHLLVMHHKF